MDSSKYKQVAQGANINIKALAKYTEEAKIYLTQLDENIQLSNDKAFKMIERVSTILLAIFPCIYFCINHNNYYLLISLGILAIFCIISFVYAVNSFIPKDKIAQGVNPKAWDRNWLEIDNHYLHHIDLRILEHIEYSIECNLRTADLKSDHVVQSISWFRKGIIITCITLLLSLMVDYIL